jgi:hypothetical protein
MKSYKKCEKNEWKKDTNIFREDIWDASDRIVFWGLS